MTTKINNLVDQVRNELNLFSSNFGVKINVGDSTENNRVVTVRQAIRYLNNSTFNYRLGWDLEDVYTVLLKQGLFRKLRRRNNRTDAYDINEFFQVVDRYVSKNTALKSTLGRKISSAV